MMMVTMMMMMMMVTWQHRPQDRNTDVGGVESVFTVVGQSALSPNSGLSSIGVRRYFGVGNVAGSSSISADGELKWIIQNVPQTEWTEQKLANTP